MNPKPWQVLVGHLLGWPKPRIIIQTYHVEKTDFEKKRDETCTRLAAELGRPWHPLRGAR